MFDFDGVLVNTLQFWFKLHKQYNSDFTWEHFEEMSHGNFLDSQKKMLHEKSYVWPDKYEESYIEMLNTVFTIEDILRNTIFKLHEKYTISIVSSSSAKIISDFINKEKLENAIEEILGYEIHTSKSIKINSLLKKYNIVPADAVYITDTLGDINEALECDVRSIGVTWGLHKRETLEQGNPAFIISNPTELLSAVENMLK